jgi:hypothetical protein
MTRKKYCVYGFGRLNIVKMTTVPKATYVVNKMPITVPMTFFSFIEELEKLILKFYGIAGSPQNNLEKEQQL